MVPTIARGISLWEVACFKEYNSVASYDSVVPIRSGEGNQRHGCDFGAPVRGVQWDSGFKKQKRLERSLPAFKIIPFWGSQPASAS